MKASQLFSILAAIALICSASVFQGCGDDTKDKKTASSGKASASASDKDDDDEGAGSGSNAESNAIGFYNNLLGFMSASQSPFKDLSKQIKESDDFAKSDSGRPTSWGNIYISARDFKKIPDHKFSAPKTFSSKMQEFFNTRIKTVQDSCKEIVSITDALATYYKAEDYKDDWHKKFLVSAPKLDDLMETIAEANDEMYVQAQEITEEIDRKNLAKSPVGIYVLNMRYMMDKAKEQSRILQNPALKDTRYGTGVSAEEKQQMVDRSKAAADRVDELIKEMDEMAEKYKAVDREKIKGSKLEREYDGFFANYEKGKADLRRIVRDLRERGYFNDQHNVKYYMESLYKSHNNFVDILNGK
ncbi:MAG: YiiG family protein [Puniceicoccales bacterium]|jgi:hypothetical protein|nr:YiiG family protein [Puniceicoccales bacterium]